MEPPEKRQRLTKGNDTSPTPSKEQICFIHFKDSSNGPFTYLYDTNYPKQQLKHLLEVRDLRFSQVASSVQRMEEACSKVPENFSMEHGYH